MFSANTAQTVFVINCRDVYGKKTNCRNCDPDDNVKRGLIKTKKIESQKKTNRQAKKVSEIIVSLPA